MPTLARKPGVVFSADVMDRWLARVHAMDRDSTSAPVFVVDDD